MRTGEKVKTLPFNELSSGREAQGNQVRRCRRKAEDWRLEKCGTDFFPAGKGIKVENRPVHADAQCRLGFCYLKGLDVLKDAPRGIKWLGLSAEQGHAEAQHNLGIICAAGQDVPRDYPQAYKWFSLAAVKGVRQSESLLADLERLMTREQTEIGRKALEEFVPRSSEAAPARQ
jgi:TPR repeat protein